MCVSNCYIIAGLVDGVFNTIVSRGVGGCGHHKRLQSCPDVLIHEEEGPEGEVLRRRGQRVFLIFKT